MHPENELVICPALKFNLLKQRLLMKTMPRATYYISSACGTNCPLSILHNPGDKFAFSTVYRNTLQVYSYRLQLICCCVEFVSPCNRSISDQKFFFLVAGSFSFSLFCASHRVGYISDPICCTELKHISLTHCAIYLLSADIKGLLWKWVFWVHY